MKSILLITTILLVAAVAFVFLQATDKGSSEIMDMTGRSEVSIVLTDDGYEPREVRIDKGTRVTFSTTRNNQHWPASNLHPTHDIYSEFDPMQPLEPEESWSFVFENEGTWGLHDHVRSYFTGVIYVDE